MAGSKKQMRIGAVMIALAVSMIAGQAMAATVLRGGSGLRPGGGIGQSLPEWFRIQITRGPAQSGKPPLIQYLQRSSEVGGKVGWFRLGR
jgi:hypothetical protein